MISIKNESHEHMRLRFVIDDSDGGCRLYDVPEPIDLPPMREVKVLGYEPGVHYVIEPVRNPRVPISFLQPGGDPYNRIGRMVFA